MEKLKYKKILYILSVVLVLCCALFIVGCTDKGKIEGTIIDNIATPEIIENPVATNICVGEMAFSSVLTGEFNTDGNLHFIGEDFVTTLAGELELEWEFVPNDLTKYKKITGEVIVNVYDYKIIFEENGGFEIADIYFNGIYTIEEKLLTAKNEYRFDGWTENESTTDYIEYPKTFNSTTTLYAGYRFHTADKIEYEAFYDGEVIQNMSAKAKWGGQWAEREFASNSWANSPMIGGSVDGEVIVADMINDIFVTDVKSFNHTRITSFVFNNYTTSLIGETFMRCEMLKEIVIPNTIEKMTSNTFVYCTSLERVEFEEGNKHLDNIGDCNFAFCNSLKEVVLNRIDEIRSFMFAYTNIESIVVPDTIKYIGGYAFAGCDNLNKVIIQGNNLESINGCAFALCKQLKEIDIPSNTNIYPNAFANTNLENINITKEQIEWIAKELHETYIGDASDFKVNVIYDEKYSGMNFEGTYIANTEEITLKIDKFTTYSLDALVHEFFHHYQYVLTKGVGDENINSIPSLINWGSSSLPIIILEQEGSEYMKWLEYCKDNAEFYYFIDNEAIELWNQPYIPLLEDKSNYEEYWTQPFERDARTFASWYSGVKYE